MDLENFMIIEYEPKRINWEEYYEYLAEKEDEWKDNE